MPTGSQQWLFGEFVRIVVRLREEYGTTIALSGGAAGADLLWAEAAQEAGLTT